MAREHDPAVSRRRRVENLLGSPPVVGGDQQPDPEIQLQLGEHPAGVVGGDHRRNLVRLEDGAGELGLVFVPERAQDDDAQKQPRVRPSSGLFQSPG